MELFGGIQNVGELQDGATYSGFLEPNLALNLPNDGENLRNINTKKLLHGLGSLSVFRGDVEFHCSHLCLTRPLQTLKAQLDNMF